MSTQHTSALVVAAQSGDLRAQDQLIAAYLPLVYNIVGRALNGSCDVDDVVQDTMLRALDGLSGLRAPESFRSWLVAIAMNRVRAHWRDRQNGLAADALDEHQDLADPGADFVDLTVVRLNLAGQRRETAEATRWLEPDDRALLSLWWLECAGELTREEVASALELSPQHTAVRVQRMKAQLESARVVVRALGANPPCGWLRQALEGWDGRPSALWRKRIARHARDCAQCSGLWSGLMPAEGLLAGLALLAPTAALLSGIHEEASFAAQAAGSFEPAPDVETTAPIQLGATPVPTGSRAAHKGDGSGVTGSRSSRRQQRRTSRRRAAAVGGVTALALGGGALYLVTTPGPSNSVIASDPIPAASTSVASLSESTTPPPSPTPSSSPSASASPSPSPSKASPSPSKSSAAPTKKAPAPRTSSPTPRPTRTSSGTTPSGSTAQQVITLVNQERAKAGCGPLKENSLLRSAAQKHSEDMAARNFFDHTNPDGKSPGDRVTATGYRWSSYGENIAMGQRGASSVMKAWMNSSGHRANILNCSFKEIGVGYYTTGGGPWWTQVFGTRS